MLSFIGGGSLATLQSQQQEGKLKQRFGEGAARLLLGEVLLALEHLHAHDIIFRDLRPENVLVDEEGHIRLTDFGTVAEDDNGMGADEPAAASKKPSEKRSALKVRARASRLTSSQCEVWCEQREVSHV